MEEKPTSRPPAKKGFPDWHFDHYEREVLLGFELPRRPSSGVATAAGLLQNCDLPPPLKLFSPIEEDEKRRQQSSLPTPAPPPAPSKVKEWGEEELGLDRGSPGLLRALQLSQTRAREAERKAELASIRNDRMAALLLEESLRLTAHRHWVRLLEVEISMLEKERSWPENGETRDDDSMPPPPATWCLTLALCLGIAGIGFALGYFRTWF